MCQQHALSYKNNLFATVQGKTFEIFNGETEYTISWDNGIMQILTFSIHNNTYKYICKVPKIMQ